MRASYLPPLDPARIVSDYLSGIGVQTLAKVHHADSDTISAILTAAGVAGTLDRRARTARRGPAPHLWRAGPTVDLPDTTWAYLAGLFDGEGTLSAPTRLKQMVGWRLAIAQRTDTGLCEWVRDTLTYGTVNVHTQPRKHDVSNWRTGAQLEVMHFLGHTLPYLRVKQAKAREAYRQLEEDR